MLHLLLTATLLTQSPASPGDELISRQCFVTPEEIGKAPIPVPPPQGLPEAKRMDGGTLIPHPLDYEVERQLRCGKYWPDACQATLDGQKSYFDAQLQFELKVQRKLVEQLGRDPTEGSIPWIPILAGGTVLVMVVGAAGFIAGYVVGTR